MRKLLLAANAAFLLVSTPSAFAHDAKVGDIEIGHPWTRATPPAAKVGGGYLTVTNKGDSADRLLGGSSAIASRVEVHNMEMTDGVMKMRPVPEGLEIPVGQTVELAPGGYHLMLIELKEPIAEGDMVAVTLEFEKAGSVEVELAAGAIGSTPSGGGHSKQPDAAPSSAHEGH